MNPIVVEAVLWCAGSTMFPWFVLYVICSAAIPFDEKDPPSRGGGMIE